MNTTEDRGDNVNDMLGKTFPTLITSFGVIINLLSICGILGCKPLRKWKNVFIFNLSLSDCVSSLGILLKFVFKLSPKDQEVSWTQPMFTTGLILSILSTLAIALQRFIIVRFDPVGERHIITPCRSVLVCVIGWLTVSGLHILAYYLEGNQGIVSRIATAIIIWTAILLTVSCYGWIYRRIASASIFIGILKNGLSEEGVNVSKRIVVTFSLVIASTFVCWIPMSLILLMEGLGIMRYEREWVSVLSRLAFNLLCLNQVINPIIYWFRLTEFRDQLRMCGGRRRRSEQDVAMTSNLTVTENDLEGNRLIHS